ncbi:hypothetical protein RBXJA2T_09662 [Rubrivivax benzoatilyticus JA2 = ATCC BAA-35]|nr:hypothetical protein RBXJA2T_09662 [Rubrivivax benzoatilyticus JA2 = ATCC BAA-35]
MPDAARRLHLGDVAGHLADQRARDRAADRDPAFLQVGLVVTDDLVGDLGPGVLVGEVDRGAEDDLAAGVQRRRVDDLGRGELALELLDPAFDEALLVLGRVVLGVLGQVALGTSLGDGLDDRMALDGLQALQFFLQLFGAAPGQGGWWPW